MASFVPFSGYFLESSAIPDSGDDAYTLTDMVPQQRAYHTEAAAAAAHARPLSFANSDYPHQEASLCYPLETSASGNGVTSGAPPGIVTGSPISGTHDDLLRNSQHLIGLLHPSPPLSMLESEETVVAVPEAVNSSSIAADVGGGGRVGAEEDEAANRDAAQIEQCGAHCDAWRLHVHPAVAAAAAGVSLNLGLAADPITAALARQQQQQRRGEPRSPLSPHTLQALCTASAEGRQSRFLAQLTADDVFAPPPLALTWYPSAPPGITKYAERKRTSNDCVVAAMHQHEKSMLAEEEDHGVAEMELADSAPPLRLPRTEELATSREGLPPPSPPLSLCASVCAGISSHGGHIGRCVTDQDNRAATPVSPSVTKTQTNTHRKRDRDERVYEYLSHGRRLR
ncbi:hypothetical protein JKF63_05032 [Porcisia hertigi]|uniref:Uncharacterized protein n=1 Tax=Porcisia hertigi TaxID=2761500 RepID=A0A836IHL2_9TRYP|nr:hypothetical protein JKF63_05032 [Porcisia hertigi]